MNNQIKKILEDLYALDTQLKSKETELVKIINQILAAKPDTKFDADFASGLRMSILKKSSAKQERNTFMKFKLLLPALTVIVVAVIAGISYYQSNNTVSNSGLALQITKVSDNAFGSLAELGNSAKTAGLGGGGMGGNAQTATPEQASGSTAVGGGGAGGGSDISIFPPPDYTQYKYIYKGEKLELSENELEVLKKVKGQTSATAFVNALRGSNNIFDFGHFNNLKLQNFSVFEDRADGYRIDVDLFMGTASISEQTPDAKIMYDNTTGTKPQDLPADQELINIAKEFLSSRNITMTGYGEPEVLKYWLAYPLAQPGADQLVLHDVSVIFPLNINGQIVHDQSGGRFGLTVNIRLQDRRVTGVWNLNLQQYQASRYAAETNVDRILQIAERGGLYYYNDLSFPPSKIVEVELGTPTKGLMQFWKYTDGKSDELLVPALIFPVTSEVPVSKYQMPMKQIIVPLIKDVLDNAQPPVMIMEKAQ